MRLWTLISGTLMFCLLWFLGWETWAVIKARGQTEAVFARFADAAPRWDDLSPKWQATLIAVEDPNFMTHRGVDIFAAGAGPFTVTEMLSRTLYFERFTPGFAEIEQSLIALLVIDPKIAKADQATAFLHLARFRDPAGQDIIGFPTAARAFFGRPLTELRYWEFVSLVAAVIAPYEMRPNTPANRLRVDRILALMRGECAPVDRADVWYKEC